MASRWYGSTDRRRQLPTGCRALLLTAVAMAAMVVACSRQDGTEELLAAGDQALAAGQVDAAIASFRLAVARDSLHADALGGLARAYRAAGNERAAYAFRQRAAHQAYQLATMAQDAGRDSAAAVGFRRVLEHDPEHVLALNALGDLARRRGLLDSAAVYYQRSAAARPTFATTHVRLGDLHLQRGDHAAARAAYAQAIAQNASALEAYMGLGRLASAERRWADAVEAYGTALRIRPGMAAAAAGLREAQGNL